jgi:quinol monooxygenase YgiN
MADPQVIMLADLHGLAGRLPELKALLTDLVAGSRTESGCESFRFFPSEDPGEVFLVSIWADQAALRRHYDTPHYRRYRDAVGPLLARPSDVTVYRVSDTVHARDPNPPDPGMFD